MEQCDAHSVCISRVQPSLYLTRYIRQRGVFVSQFISTMVFADTSYTMNATSLYAFLVWYNQVQIINADFGRLVGKVKYYNYERENATSDPLFYG